MARRMVEVEERVRAGGRLCASRTKVGKNGKGGEEGKNKSSYA